MSFEIGFEGFSMAMFKLSSYSPQKELEKETRSFILALIPQKELINIPYEYSHNVLPFYCVSPYTTYFRES